MTDCWLASIGWFLVGAGAALAALNLIPARWRWRVRPRGGESR